MMLELWLVLLCDLFDRWWLLCFMGFVLLCCFEFGLRCLGIPAWAVIYV